MFGDPYLVWHEGADVGALIAEHERRPERAERMLRAGVGDRDRVAVESLGALARLGRAPSDAVALLRLAHRDSGRWDTSAVDAFLGWAAWHREHARDPQHLPEAITDCSAPDMAWHRWTAGDPRWSTHILDTTDEPVSRSVDKIEQWVAEQREAHRSGRLPLTLGWAGRPT